MKRATKFIVEPDTQGNGVHMFSEHKTKEDAMLKIRYWLKRGIKPELYDRKMVLELY